MICVIKIILGRCVIEITIEEEATVESLNDRKPCESWGTKASQTERISAKALSLGKLWHMQDGDRQLVWLELGS